MQYTVGRGAEQTEDAMMAMCTDYDQVGSLLLRHPEDFLLG
ncbi:hypothetical protein MNBD_GAMMA15-2446, partial [hydrothermal vent metagenome]